MRKFHRWLAVLFGVFLLWISVTGVLSQIVPIVQRGGFESAKPPVAAIRDAAPAKFVCPAEMTCRPKGKGKSVVGFLHDLHSGAAFGPIGTIVSALSGLALLFFAFSGLWMYTQMWRNRSAKNLKPGWFWN